jgi:hypothetical protein
LSLTLNESGISKEDREKYAGHALDLLRKAKEQDYFAEASNSTQLREHEDFRPLQSFPAFQQLLEELKAK